MENSHKRLVYSLESQLNESDSSMFEVGELRERNHRFYSLQPLGNEQRGKSQYISPDVLDSVESKKSLFKETFCTGRQVVKFKPVQNPVEADAKTAYAEMVLNKNHKERLFRDGWHDAFVAKRMVVLATWKPDTRIKTMQIQGANQQQLMALIAQEKGLVGVKQDQMQQLQPGVFAGELELEIDDSTVRLELVQPERYYRDPNADYPENAMWNTYEEDVSRGELIERGYDPDQVDGLSMDYRFRSEEEDTSRKAHDRSWTRRRQHKRTTEQENVTSYRTWTWLDMEDQDEELGGEGMQLWEIHWSQGEILRWKDGTMAIREADAMPFFEWTEYKISHAEHGMADADIVAHTQRVQSTLKRLVIDNQQMRNSTRYEAVMGTLLNPRDLLDNKIGGVVWVKRLGSIMPLATPELSPMTMAAIAMLQSDNDKRSGMSDLAKGMNADAVKYQNAEGLIDKLTTAGNRRVMGAARDWAQTFLVPLCQFIVQLAMDNDKSQRQLEAGGRVIPVVPSQWADSEMNMAVARALTPDEGKAFASMLMMMHGTMSQDPQMSQLYGVSQKHALFDDIFDAIGVEDTTRYMMRPDSPEFQQVIQQQQAAAQQEQQKAEQLQQENVQLLKSNDKRLWEEFNWRVTNDMDDNNRADRELDQKINYEKEKIELSGEELELERDQKRAVGIG